MGYELYVPRPLSAAEKAALDSETAHHDFVMRGLAGEYPCMSGEALTLTAVGVLEASCGNFVANLPAGIKTREAVAEWVAGIDPYDED